MSIHHSVVLFLAYHLIILSNSDSSLLPLLSAYMHTYIHIHTIVHYLFLIPHVFASYDVFTFCCWLYGLHTDWIFSFVRSHHFDCIE